ncbi:SET domain-containing protein [Artomyces pyxidatus]|uniref:SET domain-containing protein n=1 Tax=Artomyces pyxidatus TaxID=48021 RepID=A0ACB8T231_9AGAM|nr:SET domain-containing protein [Artomyces pyxidatus]
MNDVEDVNAISRFLVTDYSEAGDELGSSAVAPLRSTQVVDIQPHAPYEACAPATRNIFVGDDPDHMPFIPFEDDPTFDRDSHMEMYRHLAWQTLMHNPDLEFIVLEAAARLQERYNMSLNSIDETSVLPYQLMGEESVSIGLVHRGLQRDFPRWHNARTSSLRNPANQPLPAPYDLSGRLESVYKTFCPSVSCIQPYCPTHIRPHVIRTPRAIQFSQEDMITLVKEPCKRSCFAALHVGDTAQWSESDVSGLRGLLKLEPDALPCDLAVMLRKPCREVSIRRLRPRDLLAVSFLLHRSHETQYPRVSLSLEPCTHLGPCRAESECMCSAQNAHCERNCHCALDCPRRWRGCRCRGAKACRTSSCPCYKAGRECDPEQCQPCKGRSALHYPASACRNTALQGGRCKTVEVRQGQFGLGLHVLEPVAKGDFLLEYIGELLYGSTVECREYVALTRLLARHRGRNYVFGLDKEYTIDAAHVGNAARYINHAPVEEANCSATVRYVNGEYRIGIYAEKGLVVDEELLLDYGPDFFPNQ